MSVMDDLPYYDLDGNEIDFAAWAVLIEQKHTVRGTSGNGSSSPGEDPTRIGWDERGDVTVSTVWLGIDHRFGQGPPLIFETMIFGGPHDQEQWRYSTREEAEKGHAEAVALAFGDMP